MAGDHPRVCGEKLLMRLLGTSLGGSPPRMRGKAWAAWIPSPCIRITPAYAGKSGTIRHGCAIRWDHPRVCGEKELPTCEDDFMEGSPPRMRGKVELNVTSFARQGITPAYAGKRILDL